MNNEMSEYIDYLHSIGFSKTSTDESIRLFCNDLQSLKRVFEKRINLFDECHK